MVTYIITKLITIYQGCMCLYIYRPRALCLCGGGVSGNVINVNRILITIYKHIPIHTRTMQYAINPHPFYEGEPWG